MIEIWDVQGIFFFFYIEQSTFSLSHDNFSRVILLLGEKKYKHWQENEAGKQKEKREKKRNTQVQIRRKR